MGLTDQYSGIVLNQNLLTSTQADWRGTLAGNWVYQTFSLPADYQRGSSPSELRIPDLSGFQIMVSVDQGFAASASLDYVLEYYGGDNDGWLPLTDGTVIGAHIDGLSVWYDVIFTQPVPIPISLASKRFRIGVQTRTAVGAAFNQPVSIGAANQYVINGQGYTATLTPGVPFPIEVGGVPAFLLQMKGQVTYFIQQGISTLWYVAPTPLVDQGQAYQADGITPLLGAFSNSCLNFRILGLSADNGTDFLRNEYRSVVINAAPGNTDTTSQAALGSSDVGYWLGPPLPSRFAVQSMYFDVRPVATSPTFGTVNGIGNPSFEYDAIGGAPQWWSPFANGGTVNDQTVHSTTLVSSDLHYAPWSADKTQALHMKYTFSGINQQLGIISDYQIVSATAGGSPTPISISIAYDILTATNSSLYYSLLFYDKNKALLASPYGTQNFDPAGVGQGTFAISTTMPPNTVYMRYMVSALSTGAGAFDAYVDAVQATFTTVGQPYFDGDDVGCQWIAQRGQSPSARLVTSTLDDNTVVIDGALVDPITPNMNFNVYYSQDDAYTSDSMTESDWEQKLWSRVPRVFLCNQRQQYMFPEPVLAKYMKIEFTNLQARSYTPGNFSKPITYKKFPTWVTQYFISLMETPSFIASQINVEYNALDFAYDYVLDDLLHTPLMPTASPTSVIAQLTDYFNRGNNVRIDPTTLNKIRLNMKPYQSPLGVSSDTTLGILVTNLTAGTVSTTPLTMVEGSALSPIDYSTVSTLQRDSLVFEQSLPPMYFFITCRHSYKELSAPLDHNRAYFAGVNNIAFLRNNYTIADDTPLYIESGGDPANIEFTDWQLDGDEWFTY